MPVPGNFIKLPDVALPKVKNLLNYIARPPQRSPRVQNGTRSETYHSYESAQSETPLSTPVTEDKPFLNDAPYETITGQKEMTPPLPPPPAPQDVEDDHFGLADQIRGTPERSLKGKKKKNRRSHEIHDDMIDTEDVPPPLPPKKLSPSPRKGLSIDDDEEVEAIPVKVCVLHNFQHVSRTLPYVPRIIVKFSSTHFPSHCALLLGYSDS